MVAAVYLMTCALTLGQAGDRADWQLVPQLTPGLELVYQGSYLEESLIPNVQFQRQYRLETTLLVLEARPKHWDLAVLTALTLQDARQADKPAPSSVRLETIQVDGGGRVRGADGKPLTLPIMAAPQVEFGLFAEVPPGRVSRNTPPWEVPDAGRPPRTWQVVGTEVCNGLTCVKLEGRQQSDDWARPRADTVAWRRHDTLWLAPQHAVAQKVERVIERRDPAREAPTQRATVRYELESRLKYPGRLFEDRRQEIRKAAQFQADARAWLGQPAQYRPQIEAMLKRVGQHVEHHPPTPYRKAVLQLRHDLEVARRGDAPAAVEPDEPITLVKAVGPGQRVPDFVVSSLTAPQSTRLNRCLGRPVLVMFYNPATATGRDVMVYAKGLVEKDAAALSVLAMAVTPDAETARKQHRDLRLPFPVLDGQGMRLTFGAESTPRVVLLDADGVVRYATTGWGYHTPAEIADELRRCRPK